MAKQVRIKDIAIRAGVSAGTVDRVLHNRGEVKPKTKELILKIAKELDYKPNVAARLLKASTEYHIAILLPKPLSDTSFWTNHPLGIENGISSSSPYLVKATYFEFNLSDEADFLDKTKELIEARPDGVIMAPLYRNESIAFCSQLDDLQLPYVFIDTDVEGANTLSYIGEDPLKSGRIAASLVDAVTGIDKDILIVNISKNLVNTHHLNARNQGFMSYFIEKGKNQGLKISVDIPKDDEQIVKQKLDSVFQSKANIGAILVSGSRTYVIARYLEAAGLDKVLVGYESIAENVNYLKAGVIDFLVSQRPVYQAEKALRLLLDALVNKTCPQRILDQQVDILNSETV